MFKDKVLNFDAARVGGALCLIAAAVGCLVGASGWGWLLFVGFALII